MSAEGYSTVRHVIRHADRDELVAWLKAFPGSSDPAQNAFESTDGQLEGPIRFAVTIIPDGSDCTAYCVADFREEPSREAVAGLVRLWESSQKEESRAENFEIEEREKFEVFDFVRLPSPYPGPRVGWFIAPVRPAD